MVARGTIWLQSLRYLLSGSLYEKFSDPYSRSVVPLTSVYKKGVNDIRQNLRSNSHEIYTQTHNYRLANLTFLERIVHFFGNYFSPTPLLLKQPSYMNYDTDNK